MSEAVAISASDIPYIPTQEDIAHFLRQPAKYTTTVGAIKVIAWMGLIGTALLIALVLAEATIGGYVVAVVGMSFLLTAGIAFTVATVVWFGLTAIVGCLNDIRWNGMSNSARLAEILEHDQYRTLNKATVENVSSALGIHIGPTIPRPI